MTDKEAKNIQELTNLLISIKQENNEFRTQISKQVDGLKQQVETKELPITLELDILKTVQVATNKAVLEVLSGYNSPLSKLIIEVVNNHSPALKQIISEAFNAVISTEEFKVGIRTAFAHKVAKTIISNHEGLYDKVSNELKSDATFKARATLAISNIVTEFLEGNK